MEPGMPARSARRRSGAPAGAAAQPLAAGLLLPLLAAHSLALLGCFALAIVRRQRPQVFQGLAGGLLLGTLLGRPCRPGHKLRMVVAPTLMQTRFHGKSF